MKKLNSIPNSNDRVHAIRRHLLANTAAQKTVYIDANLRIRAFDVGSAEEKNYRENAYYAEVGTYDYRVNATDLQADIEFVGMNFIDELRKTA